VKGRKGGGVVAGSRVTMQGADAASGSLRRTEDDGLSPRVDQTEREVERSMSPRHPVTSFLPSVLSFFLYFFL